jgi:hypothetical protein
LAAFFTTTKGYFCSSGLGSIILPNPHFRIAVLKALSLHIFRLSSLLRSYAEWRFAEWLLRALRMPF